MLIAGAQTIQMSSLRSMFPAISEPFANSENRMNVPAARLVSEVSRICIITKLRVFLSRISMSAVVVGNAYKARQLAIAIIPPHTVLCTELDVHHGSGYVSHLVSLLVRSRSSIIFWE